VKYYSGIGARKTPVNILDMMQTLSSKLEKEGFILRSGGADGADTAFERGVEDPNHALIYTAQDLTPDAMQLTSKFHPAWNKCSDYVKKLHARNTLIILGRDLKTPASFIVCWTQDAQVIGGTGQGIRIAQAYNIPVFNLANATFVI